jgi:hypothetical protein
MYKTGYSDFTAPNFIEKGRHLRILLILTQNLREVNTSEDDKRKTLLYHVKNSKIMYSKTSTDFFTLTFLHSSVRNVVNAQHWARLPSKEN